MNDKTPTYRAQFAAIPEPLRKQIFIRLGSALAFFLLSVLVSIAMFDWMAVIPFICLTIFSLVSAWMLYARSAAGDYVVIQGRCAEVAATPIRKRCKSILVQTDEHLIRLMMKGRLKRILVGANLEIYVATKTPMYEKDGAQILHTYLAIRITQLGH